MIREDKMEIKNNQAKNRQAELKKTLDKRLDSIGWALIFVMIGALFLAPEEWFPEGTWLIGTGGIIMVLSGVRRLYGIKIDGFWPILGILALTFGLNDALSWGLPIFPALLILFGVVIIFKAPREKGCSNCWKWCWKD